MPVPRATKEDIIKRLLKHRKINRLTGCWEWQRCIGTSGYGRTAFGRLNGHTKSWNVHRLSFFVFRTRKWNPDLFVLHKCNNRLCFNPNHLYQGTFQDNANDMVAAGNSNRGNKHPMRKLNYKDVELIRNLRRVEGVSVPILVKKFGVCRAQIYNILNGNNWR